MAVIKLADFEIFISQWKPTHLLYFTNLRSAKKFDSSPVNSTPKAALCGFFYAF
jgi:hypothetical protein